MSFPRFCALLRLPPAWPMLFFAVVFLTLLYRGTVFLDPDTGWHIAAGRWIAAHGALPAHDPWSYTAGETPWYNLAWFFDLLLAGGHAIGGTGFLFLLSISFFALLAAILCHQAQQCGANLLVCIVLGIAILLPVLMSMGFCRPQLLAVFLLLAFQRLLAADALRPQNRHVWLLPLLMVVWVNSHGSFLLVPVLFACHALAALWERDRVRFWRLVLLGAPCALAMLANPYGIHIVQGAMMTMGSVMHDYITEWDKPDVFALPYAAVLLAFLFGLRMYTDEQPLAGKIFAIVLLFMTLESQRQVLFLAVAAYPLLCAGMTQALLASPLAPVLRERHQAYSEAFSRDAVRRAMAVACAGMVLLAALPPTRGMMTKESGELYALTELRQALAVIARDHPDRRWLNQYGLGGSLAYLAGEDFPSRHLLFVDGRADTAYSRELLQDYLLLSGEKADAEGFDALREKYGITGIIGESGSALARHAEQPGAWRKVFSQGKIAVYIYAP